MIGRVAMLSLHTSPLDQPGTGSGGGMNVYVRELARALGSADVEVDIFTRSSEGALVIPDAPHVQVIALPMGPAGPLAKGELEAILPDCVRAIRDYAAATGRPHALVHSHYWLSGLAGIELAGAWSVPLVHMFHTLSRIKTRLAGSAPDPRRARGEARVLRAADAVVVANQVERAQILDLYRAGTAPLVTIPCGIDPAPFEAAHTAHRGDAAVFCIAALGRAERLKHFDLLLHAVAVACRREPAFARAVRVQLAGGPSSEEPETLPALQRLASTLGIADRVAFLGPVAHAAVPALYAGADVCVVPSRYESFGLVALEAMAAGLPVGGDARGRPATDR